MKYERFDPPPVGSLASTLPNLRVTYDNHFTDSATPRRSGASALINEKSPGELELQSVCILSMSMTSKIFGTKLEDCVYKPCAIQNIYFSFLWIKI